MKIKILLVGIAIFLISCVSKQKMVYLNTNNNNLSSQNSYEPVLQPDDILSITVTSENPEVAAPYNLPLTSVVNSGEDASQQRLQSYIIDKNGNIQFPLIGNIKLSGLTKTEANQKIMSVLKSHVRDALVHIRILNFKVSILGEVAKPGSFNIKSERITIFEALSLAGDLTIYGKRDNVLLIREENGVKSMNRIDLTNSQILESPYYYLNQNDVIYVEPNGTRVNSSAVGPNITVGISALSLLITIIVLVTK